MIDEKVCCDLCGEEVPKEELETCEVCGNEYCYMCESVDSEDRCEYCLDDDDEEEEDF